MVEFPLENLKPLQFKAKALMEKMKLEVTSYFSERLISTRNESVIYNCIIGTCFRPDLEMLFLKDTKLPLYCYLHSLQNILP